MSHDPTQQRAGVSRRGFLKGVGATTVSGGLIHGSSQAQAQVNPNAPIGPGEVSIKLNINGQDRTLSVDTRTTLLDALRNHLELSGAKKVCDRATCGACTAFLQSNPNPTAEQIRAGLGGNLCRCGTYEGIKQAVLDAAAAMKGGA